MTKIWQWWGEHWLDIVFIALVVWFLYQQRQLVINFQMNNCPSAGKPDIRQSYKI